MWMELAKRTREINGANGWEAPTWEKLLNKTMLTVTELHEAVLVSHRRVSVHSKEESFGVELADTAIRIFDILEAIWPDAWSERRHLPDGRDGSGHFFQPAEVAVWPIVGHLCEATEWWRKEKQIDCRIALELALAATFKLADELRYDLVDLIQKKLEKNATRGYLHGKARADG